MSAELDALAGAGVATVYEAYGRRGLIDVELVPARPGSAVAGPARTVLCGQDDNRAVHEAMTHARPGEVLVLTMPRPAPIALLGDLLATQAQVAGLAGVLVDAAVRDSPDLRRSGPPVWSRWRRCTGATKTLRGHLHVPVTVGGALIQPGDVVVLDDDGATCVAAADLAPTVAAVRARLEKESGLRARWRDGELSYDAYGLRAEDEEDDR